MPETVNNVLTVLNTLLKKAIEWPHILRHTFSSRLAMKGATAKSIQDLAGHRDLATTQRYMHLSPSALDDAIKLLDGTRNFGDMFETADREKLSR